MLGRHALLSFFLFMVEFEPEWKQAILLVSSFFCFCCVLGGGKSFTLLVRMLRQGIYTAFLWHICVDGLAQLFESYSIPPANAQFRSVSYTGLQTSPNLDDKDLKIHWYI